MSGDGLFHIARDQTLVAMTVTPYEAEDVLQELLETYPDLLAGAQMNPQSPRRWALVKREQGVPDRLQAQSRWSVDHLFVDQDAIPTLVEVKRASDTRIRREVVGQMLDYAANGIRYWAIEELQTAFEATQQALGHDPRESLLELCGDPALEVTAFFERVRDNLRAGKIRMVFVADLIPDELMRIVEFLNEQMESAEVFAVEVKRYQSDRHEGTVIVPAVYGRTSAASKKHGLRKAIDRQTRMAASESATLEAVRLFDDLAAELGLVVETTPSGNMLKTPRRHSVANVYLAEWDSVDIDLRPLRERGWGDLADEVLTSMQRMTTKRLTTKNPILPAADAISHWSDLKSLLERVARCYANEEASEAGS